MNEIKCEYMQCGQAATIMIGFTGKSPSACFICSTCFKNAMLDYQRAGLIGQIVILPAHSPAAEKWHADANRHP